MGAALSSPSSSPILIAPSISNLTPLSPSCLMFKTLYPWSPLSIDHSIEAIEPFSHHPPIIYTIKVEYRSCARFSPSLALKTVDGHSDMKRSHTLCRYDSWATPLYLAHLPNRFACFNGGSELPSLLRRHANWFWSLSCQNLIHRLSFSKSTASVFVRRALVPTCSSMSDRQLCPLVSLQPFNVGDLRVAGWPP
ncbi:hypothetical protein CPB84DRAFT_1855358 [Gymnopilus junonius]|uniref:Uncharacterized protein n=1 Tax=Gymnopilus junonius TaxID=109634 RepID=A0A9P5N7V5_GYMJU|nr:hypothetical protein CPB84DRAFT_1855358 [Gymnopilus junonius]